MTSEIPFTSEGLIFNGTPLGVCEGRVCTGKLMVPALSRNIDMLSSMSWCLPHYLMVAPNRLMSFSFTVDEICVSGYMTSSMRDESSKTVFGIVNTDNLEQ